MEKMNALTLIITLVVGVILTGALLGPVINDATTTEHKIINTGAYNLTDNDDNYTITYDPTGKFIIGDKEIPFNTLPNDAITIASAKDMLLRFQNWAAQSYNVWLFIDGEAARVIASNTNTSPVDIVFDNGSFSANAATISASYTSDESVRIFNPDGKYTMTIYDQPATVLKDTTVIVGNGTTAVNAWTNRFYIEGTAEDIDITPSSGITVSNVAVNTTEISQYKDAVKLNSITFTATDGTNTVDATYNRVIVPIEIDAELSQHLTPGQISLVGAIPVMVIVALLMTAVGAIAYRRAD